LTKWIGSNAEQYLKIKENTPMKTSTVCLITLLAGWSRFVLGVPILDQSQTSLGSGEFVQNTILVAQTFTSSLNGHLDSINLVLNSNNSAEAKPLFVSIYDTQGGFPGSVLGTTSLNNVSGSFFATYTIDFSGQNIFLNSHVQYAIVLGAPGTFNGFYVRGSVGDTYSGGLTLTQASPGAAWVTDTRERDFAFQTFMNVPDSTNVTVLVASSLFLISFSYFQKRAKMLGKS
jgi:hypothetical protein